MISRTVVTWPTLAELCVPPQTGGGKGQRKTRQKAEKPKEERRQYCFRKRKEVNYMTLEVPNDDEFIYCEECDQEFQRDCPEHGPFHVVDDTAVEVKKRGDPQRAVKTLPPGLEVRESGIPNAGLGAFATQLFPTRSRFGPYQVRRVTDPDIAHASGYCWQISSDKGYSYFVDAKDCKAANWMRYLNCARTRAEQNVTAYQHCGEVYYRAHCDIQPGTEILMWYGREYGKELGIIREEDEPRKKKRPSVTQLEPDKDKDSDEHLTCSDSDVRTSDIEFSDSDDSRHQQNINRPRVMKKPPTHTPSLPRSANTPGSLLSLDRSHVCHCCSAAFVLFNSLKLHVKHVHGENLQVVLPVASTPDGCGDGNHGDNMGKDVVNASNGKAVERMKEENDRKNIGKKDEGKRDGPHGTGVGPQDGPHGTGVGHGMVPMGQVWGHGMVPMGQVWGHGMVPMGQVWGHGMVPMGQVWGHGMVPMGQVWGHGMVPMRQVWGHGIVPMGQVWVHGMVPMGQVWGHRMVPMRQVWVGRGNRIKEPANRNKEPANRNKEPANRNKEPANRNKEPANRHKEPANRNKEPANRNKEPANRNKEPANRNKEPANRNEEPANRNKEPANRNKEPANRNKEPANRNNESANRNKEPANRNKEPANRNKEPANRNEEPANRNKEPANRNKEPANRNKEPANRNKEPANRNEDFKQLVNEAQRNGASPSEESASILGVGRSNLDIDVPHGGRMNCLVSPLRLARLKQGPHWDLWAPRTNSPRQSLERLHFS
ncbi:hypothetical protein ACOMHN_057828 [Nucella lapillus]